MLTWMQIRAWWSAFKVNAGAPRRPSSTPSPQTGRDPAGQFVPEWSAQPGFHERRLRVRYDNVFFPLARRGVSEHEFSSAKETDAEMFKRFEDSALFIIGWSSQQRGKTFGIAEADRLRKEVEETINFGSGLGSRAHDLLQVLTAVCGAMGAEIENGLIKANPNDEAEIRQSFNRIRTLNQSQRHQAYIDVVRAEPADMLPTLLSCSADDLRFLFQDLPPGAAEASTYWKNVKADLRAFAIRLMCQCADAKQKLLQDPVKLELLGIAVSPRTVTQTDAPAEYVDFEVLRQKLLSEEADAGMERLLADLKQKFGDRIPLSQLIEFTECEIANGKAQMKGLVEKAHSEGKTISIETIRKILEKAMAEYTGRDRDVFNERTDQFIESLRAQYGDQISVVEGFKLLQRLGRAAGVTDSVNQFPLK